jgi:hypothetical protein
LLLAQFRIFWIGLELRIDLHEASFQLQPHGAQSILRLLLFFHNWAIDPDFACIVVDDDVVGVRNWLWPSRSRAGALSEDVMPVFLVVDSGLKKLPVTKADNRDEDWQRLRHHHHGYYFVYRHDAVDVADVAGRKPNGHREGGWHVNCADHLNGRCGRRSA